MTTSAAATTASRSSDGAMRDVSNSTSLRYRGLRPSVRSDSSTSGLRTYHPVQRLFSVSSRTMAVAQLPYPMTAQRASCPIRYSMRSIVVCHTKVIKKKLNKKCKNIPCFLLPLSVYVLQGRRIPRKIAELRFYLSDNKTVV